MSEKRSPCLTCLIFFIFSCKPAVAWKCWENLKARPQGLNEICSQVFTGPHLLSSELRYDGYQERWRSRYGMKNMRELLPGLVEIKSEFPFDRKRPPRKSGWIWNPGALLKFHVHEDSLHGRVISRTFLLRPHPRIQYLKFAKEHLDEPDAFRKEVL